LLLNALNGESFGQSNCGGFAMLRINQKFHNVNWRGFCHASLRQHNQSLALVLPLAPLFTAVLEKV